MTSTIAAAREPGYITDPRTYRNGCAVWKGRFAGSPG